MECMDGSKGRERRRKIAKAEFKEKNKGRERMEGRKKNNIKHTKLVSLPINKTRLHIPLKV